MSRLTERFLVRGVLCTLLFVLINCTLAIAQDIVVQGVVTDKDGAPIYGASVVVKGSTVGTVTDANGKYYIRVSKNAEALRFSYVGMVTRDTPVKSGFINVELEEDAKDLDEIVIVGYGVQKKKDLTGSIASVNTEEIVNLPVSNVAESLTGKIAGVHVTTTDGAPDAEIKIRVRGGGSITQNNTPLYIVDGFPVSSISEISPSEIESIDVLKDASAASIYGSRGANGVIIITTKTPKDGKLSLSYNGNFGTKKISKTLDVLNPYEYVKSSYEHAVLSDKVENNFTSVFGAFDNIASYQDKAQVDWQDEVFGRTGSILTHDVSLTGGTETTNFVASYNRVDDEAIMLDSKYSKNNFAFKANLNPIDWAKLTFNTRYSDSDAEGAGANDMTATINGATSDTRVKHALIYAPFDISNILANTDDDALTGTLINPLVNINDNYRSTNNKLYTFNGSVAITLSPSLQFKSDFGIDNRTKEENRYQGSTTYTSQNSTIASGVPLVTITNTKTNRTRNTNTLSYDLQGDGDHGLNVLLGEETNVTESSSFFNEVHNIPDTYSPEQAFGFLTEGTALTTKQTYNADDKMLSFFGRVNYDYKGKYLLSASLRADGSNKFSQSNRWGYFPSVALGWRISDEPYVVSNFRNISNLKLRASYGVAGNNNIASGQYYRTFTSSTEAFMNNFSSYWNSSAGKKLTNKDLKWETTTTFNLGLDFGLYNNRISGSVEVYQNDVKDLLLDFSILSTGYSTMTKNIGQTRNRGVELTLNADVVKTKNWKVSLAANISRNQNEIVDLGGSDFSQSSLWSSNSQLTDDYQVMVGKPVGQIYGYVTDGFYSVDDFEYTGAKWKLKNQDENTPDNSTFTSSSWGPGALKLKDLDKNGVIDDNDKTIIGDATPDFTGGFNLSASYKWIDLSAAFTFSVGNDIYNANRLECTNEYKYFNRNLLGEMKDRFTHINWATGERITDANELALANADAKIWSPYMGEYLVHSWAVEDGSFLRLSSLTVGCTIPSEILEPLYIKGCRIYFTATNLFCWTSYTGYDPEVDSRRSTPLTPGVDYSAYPKSTGYNVGINLTF